MDEQNEVAGPPLKTSLAKAELPIDDVDIATNNQKKCLRVSCNLKNLLTISWLICIPIFYRIQNKKTI